MQHCFFATIERIIEIIDVEKREITNRELIEICAEDTDFFITDPHFCHEIAETALNLLIARKYAKGLLSSKEPAAICSDVLRPLLERLPTQSWRSSAQVIYQQFSTPTPIAYLAAYLMNLSESDTALEPSCGTGSLAVWAQGTGATVITNEIDPRRQQLARHIGLDPTGCEAEFIDDFLPESISPNVLLINPPFSSSGGRVDRNQNKFGFRHVESALRRLSDNGRFAVILGEGGSPQSVSGRRFWESMLPNIRVTRSIGLPGREYYRNGTTVGITLVLGNKSAGNQPEASFLYDRHQNFRCVEEVFKTIRSEQK